MIRAFYFSWCVSEKGPDIKAPKKGRGPRRLLYGPALAALVVSGIPHSAILWPTWFKEHREVRRMPLDLLEPAVATFAPLALP